MTKGSHHTPEAKEKCRLANIGRCRKHTEETKEKIRQKKLGVKRPDLIGNKFSWKRGWYIDKEGYMMIWKERPAENHNGYLPEHRIVMEEIIGRKLDSKEHVHHKNGVKTDNRPENLELVVKTPHYGEIKCPHCQKSFLIR